ncbi:uncharacterized protein LOC122403171 [Colletes gigas]|uniref:uncharacterized protein LOC122403171 n=1 Tax=Colletes gigas TaxID=935657 RepID=UPI001C9A3DA3|nr:uncharacterized protein LOC122403171 [Colletes gigas]
MVFMRAQFGEFVGKERISVILQIRGPKYYNGKTRGNQNMTTLIAVYISGSLKDEGSADEESAERFLINFAKKVEEEGIEEHNIYNMDESGLMWKAIPSKTLVHVRDAWEDVTSNDIKNGWNKIFTKDSEDSSEDALNTTIDSEISELIHTINGEPINQELLNDFFLLLDQVENMDITEQEGEADIEEEIEGGDERHGEEEEEEQHREEEAVTELETSQELPIIQANENLEERKLRELQWIDTLIKNWGNNKPHVQIMGEAFKKILEAEALPEN